VTPSTAATETQAETQIARAAGLVMAGFVLSNLVSLIQRILVSRDFGTGADIDAFFVALRIPELLFNLVAGGALASAFLPAFTAALSRGSRQEAWRLASSLANLAALVLVTLAALAWLAAPFLVDKVLAPDFVDTKARLTVTLLRTLLATTVIFGLSGLLMAVLQAHRHFVLPALAPTLYWLGWIVGVLALAPRFGIQGLAYGVVLGAVLHLLIQIPALRGRGARYTPRLGLSDPAVRNVLRLMGPRLIGVGVVQVNFLVNTILASGQPVGSLTALQLAFAVMTMPQVVIAQSLAIAALPTFSAQAADGRWGELRNSIRGTLRGVVFLSLPASVGLILLRRPITALLFERGAFDASSTDLVAWALLWYAAGLVGHSLVEILSRAFYALQNTRTPVLVGAGAMTLNVVLSLTLASAFERAGLPPHGALALANSLATGLESVVLIAALRRRVPEMDLRPLAMGAAGTAAATLVMAGSVGLWIGAAQNWGVAAQALGGVLIGAAAFWGAALLLGVPEARRLPGLLLRRGP
jgi:putative peptidoglycan lipid II flippase